MAREKASCLAAGGAEGAARTMGVGDIGADIEGVGGSMGCMGMLL